MECANDANEDSFLGTLISSDLALRIIQYLNVVESGKLACTSQRYYYLVHQYRRLRGPELATSYIHKSRDDDEEKDYGTMANECKAKLQTKPNLVLHFGTEIFEGKLSSSFGIDTIGLGATSGEIQVYQPPATSKGSLGTLDDTCDESMMAMSLQGAVVLPFLIRGTPSASDFAFLEQRLRYHNKTGDDGFWKVMLLYSTSSQQLDTTSIQALVPNAAIVGGVCGEGHLTRPKYSRDELSSMSIKNLRYLLKQSAGNRAGKEREILEKADLVNQVLEALNLAQDESNYIGYGNIFGVVLGGNVPVRSIVSRGVHSVLNNNGPPRPYSDLVVEKAVLDLGEGENRPPLHVIQTVKDTITNTVYTPIQLMAKRVRLDGADFLGIKRVGHDGFELSTIYNPQQMNAFFIVADESEASQQSLEGAEIDFFSLNGKACMEDMDRTMSKLKEQTKGEELLGALMYTCNGRGPHAGFIPEKMSDAKRFAKAFPDVPCLGFYAGGEIGPVALAGNENVFQSGRCMHQGFTAVFAMFIVPVRDELDCYNLDDSTANVKNFIREELH